MILRNHSPFPPLLFVSRDVERNDFGVVTLLGSFELQNGMELKLVPDQEPLRMVDEYLGEPGVSSLWKENNLAPYKPNTDIHIRANAIAPNGHADMWEVGATVGSSHTSFTVTGPRIWQKGVFGWTLGEIQPTESVSIIYENAFGGHYLTDENDIEYEPNPVGTGWAPDSYTDDSMLVPQILPSGNIEPRFGEEIEPVGLLPVPSQWLQRRQLAGSFSTLWEKTRWPDLPEDFVFDFYNSGAKELIYDGFLSGNEAMEFWNLHRAPYFSATLPDIRLSGLVRFEDGQILPTPINLDTVELDLIEEKAFLGWRGIFPIDKPVRVLEVQLHAPDHLIDFSLDTDHAS